MKIVIDIEANSLYKPTKLWVIVCKDITSSKLYIFRNVTEDANEARCFRDFDKSVDCYIGHNFLGYDWPCLNNLLGISRPSISDCSFDTLILSKLVDYSRPGGHSVEQYGLEFGLEKIKFNDWTHWSQEMEDYCIRDVEICHKIYLSLLPIISDASWIPAIQMEQAFQRVVNNLHDRGFYFDSDSARVLLGKVTVQLEKIDKEIETAFPPREVLIREFTPRLTKFGTISRSSVPRQLLSNIHAYEAGKTYRHTRFDPFNPSSHKQLIEVLNEAKWKPEGKTKTHIEFQRGLRKGQELSEEERLKLEKLSTYGWQVNEHNLSTLPEDAPSPARLLAKRIQLESRRRTLTEWLGLVQLDGRIHGNFYGIGAWTHRMAHQRPNTANIPNEYDVSGKMKLLGKEMRQLWCAPENRLLVGVDAEGIQLRIFAHYIDDKEFTNALVRGNKEEKTDPHSLNQRILGSPCKTRAAAKRFVFALLLGGGIGKLAQILECSVSDAREALNRLLRRYSGFAYLKKEVIPKDAKRGFFIGLDGRKVPIPGGTNSERAHLCMSGYLQNGEAIIMKRATLKWEGKLVESYGSWLVDLVHDEWQTETPDDMKIALHVAQMQADSLESVGQEIGLRCPLAGSYWNDDHKWNTIGKNWYQTH